MLTLAAVAALAFAAATVLPLPSEAALLAAWDGGSPLMPLWIAATVGNTAGALLMMALGSGALRWPWLSARMAAPRARFRPWVQRFGAPSLLFAWVPAVGDALPVLAGLLGVPWRRAMLWLALGKGGRYAVVLATAERLAGP
jgi:membrane protein YqaA with SNARE-associated domain